MELLLVIAVISVIYTTANVIEYLEETTNAKG